jgi:hypothetical protein
MLEVDCCLRSCVSYRVLMARKTQMAGYVWTHLTEIWGLALKKTAKYVQLKLKNNEQMCTEIVMGGVSFVAACRV